MKQQSPDLVRLLALAGRTDGDAPHLTDLGNARCLIARHGDDLRFCVARGWFVYDGTRWVQDDAAAMLHAKDTVLARYAEAATLADTEARKKLAAHALRSEAEPRLRAMLSLAASGPGIRVSPEKLAADPWLVGCPHGVLDL